MSQLLRNGDGSAYGRALVASDAEKELLKVGPGTSAGEWLRRYWHPVDVSSKVTTTPKKIRILGEDLIIFRDAAGRPGLLEPHCVHRGTSLYYCKVDEAGILTQDAGQGKGEQFLSGVRPQHPDDQACRQQPDGSKKPALPT